MYYNKGSDGLSMPFMQFLKRFCYLLISKLCNLIYDVRIQFQKLSSWGVCFTFETFPTFGFKFFSPLSKFLFKQSLSFFKFSIWFLNSSYSLSILSCYFFIISNFFLISYLLSTIFCYFLMRSVFFCYNALTFLMFSLTFSLF